MAKGTAVIHDLVAQLPEIYQPILGYPEYDARASRAHDARLEEVLRLHDALVQLKKRPLKILDLGCAQGYFALSMAIRGSEVRGIDYLEANIAVCRQLAIENPGLKVSFEVDRIELTIESLQKGQYDLVLGLSVFHHLIYVHGASKVKEWLGMAASTGASLLTEMALDSEPLYWASAQPRDPMTLLEGIAFVRCLGHFPTHLSGIQRPLYISSENTWYLGGKAVHFEESRHSSHERAQDVHRGTRGYYFAAPLMAKKFATDGELGDANRNELERERVMLERGLQGMHLPRLLDAGEAHGEAWLVREMIPGQLLSDSLGGLDISERRRILVHVLTQLVGLEAEGLFHSDVRVWNVLLDEQGAPQLIDYGAIGDEAADCLWPYDIHLSFLVFAQEIASGEVALSDPLRRVAFSPGSLVPYLQSWAVSLFRRPLSEWTFAWMLEELGEHWGQTVALDAGLGICHEVWLALLEQALQLQLHNAKHLRAQIDISNFEAVQRDRDERSVAWSEKEAVRIEARERLDVISGELQELLGEQARIRAAQEAIQTGHAEILDKQEDLRIEQLGIRAEQVGIREGVVTLQGEQVEARSGQEEIRAGLARIWTEQAEARAKHAYIQDQFSQLRAELLGGVHSIQVEMMALHRQIQDEIADLHWEERVREMAQRADGVDVKLATLREELLYGSQAQAIEMLRHEVALVHGSRSWRLTGPLRRASRKWGEFKLRAKIRLRPMAVWMARTLLGMPGVRRIGRPVVSRYPRLAARLQRFLHGAGLTGSAPTPSGPTQVAELGGLSNEAGAAVPELISRRATVLSVRAGLRPGGDNS